MWSDLLKLRAWTPLSRIGLPFTQIDDDVFEIGEHAYVRTQAVTREPEHWEGAVGPFVTRAFWASSPQAVLRDVRGDPAIGADVVGISPPTELSMGTRGTYLAIREASRMVEPNFSEQAIYAPSGQFLYKVIGAGRFEYCFLDRAENPLEPTFLIRVRLLRS